jgi:hypothetical protein
MYNTDPSVPDWEKNPEQIRANNQEISAADAERAQAWAETFPNNEENPWLNADMQAAQGEQVAESQYMPQLEEEMSQTPQGEQLPPEMAQFEDPNQPQEPFSQPSTDANNELTSTDNIVTNQIREVWNNGDGGQSLEDAYDDLRGSFTAENIKTSADMVETEVSDTVRENSGKSMDSEVSLAQDSNANPDTPLVSDTTQANNDLYDLAASAGATALGAQANTEIAMTEFAQANESQTADSAQRDLEEAKQTLESIQSDIPAIAGQAEQNSSELKTAENVLHDAQQMVIDAQESLEAAQKEAEQRQEFIDDHQEEVKNLQDQGVEMEEINQAIDETGNLDSLQEENQPENNLLSEQPQFEDEFEPRQSIFG